MLLFPRFSDTEPPSKIFLCFRKIRFQSQMAHIYIVLTMFKISKRGRSTLRSSQPGFNGEEGLTSSTIYNAAIQLYQHRVIIDLPHLSIFKSFLKFISSCLAFTYEPSTPSRPTGPFHLRIGNFHRRMHFGRCTTLNNTHLVSLQRSLLLR